MIKAWAITSIDKALENFPAVVLQGPEGNNKKNVAEHYVQLLTDDNVVICTYPEVADKQLNTRNTKTIFISHEQILPNFNDLLILTCITINPLSWDEAKDLLCSWLNKHQKKIIPGEIDALVLASWGCQNVLERLSAAYITSTLPSVFKIDCTPKGITTEEIIFLAAFYIVNDPLVLTDVPAILRPIIESLFRHFHLVLNHGAYILGPFKSFYKHYFKYLDLFLYSNNSKDYFRKLEKLGSLSPGWDIFLSSLFDQDSDFAAKIEKYFNEIPSLFSMYGNLLSLVLNKRNVFSLFLTDFILSLLERDRHEGVDISSGGIFEIVNRQKDKRLGPLASLRWQILASLLKHLYLNISFKVNLSEQRALQVEQTLELRKKGQVSLAIKKIDELLKDIQDGPSRQEILQLQIVNCIQDSRYKKAREICEDLIAKFSKNDEFYPSMWNVYYNLMVAHDNLGSFLERDKLLDFLLIKRSEFTHSLASSLDLFCIQLLMREGKIEAALTKISELKLICSLTLSQTIFLSYYELQSLLIQGKKDGFLDLLIILYQKTSSYPALEIFPVALEVLFYSKLKDWNEVERVWRKHEHVVAKIHKKYLPVYYHARFVSWNKNDKHFKSNYWLEKLKETKCQDYDYDFLSAQQLVLEQQYLECLKLVDVILVKQKTNPLLCSKVYELQAISQINIGHLELAYSSYLQAYKSGNEIFKYDVMWNREILFNIVLLSWQLDKFSHWNHYLQLLKSFELMTNQECLVDLLSLAPGVEINYSFKLIKESLFTYQHLLPKINAKMIFHHSRSSEIIEYWQYLCFDRSKFTLIVDGPAKKVFLKGNQRLELYRNNLLIKLLSFFIENPRKKHFKQDLIEYVWNDQYHPEIHDRLIHATMHRLRVAVNASEFGNPIIRENDCYYLNPNYSYGMIENRKKIEKNLSSRQLWALHYIKYNQKLTNKIFVQHHKVSSRTALRDLSELVKLGHLKTEGIKKGLCYISTHS